MKKKKPPGWTSGQTEHRFADVAPSSYNKTARTVDAVISKGSLVQRFYGIEVLKISADAVILDRISSSGIPALDSHQQAGISNALGRVTKAWFTRDALMGTIAFNDTTEGRKAEGMVARGEIAGISAGYIVQEWEITDAKDRVLDPETDRISPDANLTFTATKWELLECSLVSVPADPAAVIRSLGDGVSAHLGDMLSQMTARQAAIETRQRMLDRQHALEIQNVIEQQRDLERRLRRRSGVGSSYPRHPRPGNIWEGGP